jgi:hypothetical protein
MPKIATVNSNNTSYTVTDGLFKKSYSFLNCTTNLTINSDGSKTFYLINGNETLVIVSNTLNTEHIGNSVFGSSNPDIAQTNSQGYLGSSSGIAASTATIRILANPGGASYTQAQLQTLYDGQVGLVAPDVIPQAIIDYANTLNVSGYKVYLGGNTWWYTNTATGATSSNWSSFGGSKSSFGAAIFTTGILTYK